MHLLRTERFKKDFRHLPPDVQARAIQTLERFASTPRHPSLHTKKMEGVPGIWELRVTDNYRVTLQWVQGAALLRRIGTHTILRHP